MSAHTNPVQRSLSVHNSSLSLLTGCQALESSGKNFYKLFLHTITIVLGIATIISIFTVLFFLNGLCMLDTTSIMLSSILIVLGVVFVSLGTVSLVKTVDQGLSGTLKKHLLEKNKEISRLQKLIDSRNTQEIGKNSRSKAVLSKKCYKR
ncbi:hypothetical protein CP10139811_0180 [Chlamydia ibidis]|uniref:Uncharacterized protein n=2 Tax=Chlamydia ibidis TaxID=1405396 RepID=S7KLJ2_9CHLA|nr:hypothetical protein [Chlamydia ibidis]EPP35285.1 hypothetical protein CP10139811_0180 [Chlamydia ibidis]EQM62807.1 hypothetical protein H359_0623 [Chlamydia ibidis 10-1398/6]